MSWELRKGDTAMDTPLNLQDAIFNLQTYLRALSFADNRITRVPVDGIFDSDTERAVADFQRTRGLEDTGIVDKTTWDAIYKEFKELTEKTDRSPTVNFFPQYPPSYEARLGEEHAFISLVQLLLRELSVIYDGFEDIQITGKFDTATEDATKIFQQAAQLPVTGRIDLRTWNALSRDFINNSSF